jgi:hypothetical protein
MRRFAFALPALAGLLFFTAPMRTAWGHEPIHSPGPVTLWEGGTAVELFADVQWADHLWHGSHREDDPVHGKRRGADFRLHLAHGITSDFTVILDAPLAWRAADTGGTTQRAAGLGDLWLGAKYRFWRDQRAVAQADMAAVFAFLHLDTGSQSSRPPLGNGAPEVVVGSAAAHDDLFLYLWGSVRAFVPIPGGRSLTPWGFSANAAIGTRFWEPDFDGADLVVLLETEYHAESPAARHGHQVPNTGHQRWSAGPGLFFFYNQLEFKAGVQLTLWRRARGRQYVVDGRAAIGFGVLF